MGNKINLKTGYTLIAVLFHEQFDKGWQLGKLAVMTILPARFDYVEESCHKKFSSKGLSCRRLSLLKGDDTISKIKLTILKTTLPKCNLFLYS